MNEVENTFLGECVYFHIRGKKFGTLSEEPL